MDINITLPQDAWNVVMKHLGDGAFVEVADLIEKLRAQGVAGY